LLIRKSFVPWVWEISDQNTAKSMDSINLWRQNQCLWEMEWHQTSLSISLPLSLGIHMVSCHYCARLPHFYVSRLTSCYSMCIHLTMETYEWHSESFQQKQPHFLCFYAKFLGSRLRLAELVLILYLYPKGCSLQIKVLLDRVVLRSYIWAGFTIKKYGQK
jgi:hypothetical protein